MKFLGVVEVAGRLHIAEGPARRHGGVPDEIGDVAEYAAQVRAAEKIQIERARLGIVFEPPCSIQFARLDHRACRIVDKDRVSRLRDQQGHRDVGALPSIGLEIPKPPRHAKPVELMPAFAEPVKMLFADRAQ